MRDDPPARAGWQDSLAVVPDFVTFGWLSEDSESLVSKAGWIPQENTFKIRSF